MLDVIVMGGGPSGAVCASVLARQGRSVLVLERQEFPRFHIGESMLPYMVGLLERHGLLDAVREQGYVVKRGGEFIDPTGTKFFRAGVFRADFAKTGEGRHHETFQVERSHFDRVNLDQARAAGATVREGAQVVGLLEEGGRVVGVRYREGGVEREERARYVVDATGRAGVVANRFGLRRMIEDLRMVAVFHHRDGLDEAHNPGHEGDIQVGSHADGWIWAIPLSADRISVGTVMHRDRLRGRTPAEAFAEQVERVPRINQRLTGTSATSDFWVETDYSYHSDQVVGPGWAMVGDAGCFGDPMFSGGVLVGMATGAEAAEALGRALDSPADEEQALTGYSNFFKTGYDTYVRLIFSFYEGELLPALAEAHSEVGDISEEEMEMYVVRLLGGDFWSARNPVANALRANPAWATFSPFEPVHRCPVYPELDVAELGGLAGAVAR